MSGHRITSPRSAHWLVWCWLVVPAATSATGLLAQDAVTQAAGGGGGEHYDIGCGTKSMVGVQGRWRGLAPQLGVIQALCVDVNTDGTWIGTPLPGPGIAGVNGPLNPLVVLTCPRDRAVSGISGFSGIYVDVLSIWCSPLGEYGRLHSSPALVAGSIGEPGVLPGQSAFGPFFCPDDKPGKGFTGKAHDWVDMIALVCNYPSVPPASVKSMTASPISVVGGKQVIGTVILNASAPPSGSKVTLALNNGAMGSFQTNPITVPEGQKVGSFVLNTDAMPNATVATITAIPNTGSPSAAVTVKPPELIELSLSSAKTSPGVAVTGTVSLSGPAFAGGLVVALASSDAGSVSVPATLSLSQGLASATFSATAAPHAGCSVISTTYNTVKQNAALAVFAAPPSAAFALRESATATVDVGFPAATTVARTLSVASSLPSFASVPSSIQVAAGATTTTFTVAFQRTVTGTACAVITVSDAKGNGNSFVVINADGKVTIIPGS